MGVIKGRPSRIQGEVTVRARLMAAAGKTFREVVGDGADDDRLADLDLLEDALVGVSYEAYIDEHYGADRDGERGVRVCEVVDWRVTSLYCEVDDGLTIDVSVESAPRLHGELLAVAANARELASWVVEAAVEDATSRRHDTHA
jgi:hypothetical protein